MTKKELTTVEEKTQTMPTVAGNNTLNAMMSVAEELSKSDIIPKEFQKKPANCLIAVQLANRLKADPITDKIFKGEKLTQEEHDYNTYCYHWEEYKAGLL